VSDVHVMAQNMIQHAERRRLLVEGRGFYFQDYELEAVVPEAPGLPDLERLGLIEFSPVIVNVNGGIAIRF